LSRAANITFLLSGLSSRTTGEPIAGGSVAFVEAGTTTDKAVWTEKEKTNAYYSYDLNEDGSAELFGEGEYDVKVYDADGNLLYTIEGVRLEQTYYGVRSASSSPVTMASTDDLLLIDTSAEEITINCIAAASWERPLKVRHSTGSNDVIINPSGSETINGSSTFTFNNTTIEIASDGSNLVTTESSAELSDTDNDTKIQVEESADEDIIRFDVAGTQIGTIDADGLTIDEVDADVIKKDGTAIAATAAELSQLNGVTVGGSGAGDIVTTTDEQTLISKTLINPVFGVAEDALTATSTEINTACNGITATASEINTACDGITATASEINTIADGITATASEVNTACDGITATASELNLLDGITTVSNSPTFVDNSNGNPNVSDTVLDVDSILNINAWVSIGPTDSGASNEWTALDEMSSGADYIVVRFSIDNSASSKTPGAQLQNELHVRQNGSSEVRSTDNRVAMVSSVVDDTGHSFVANVTEATIPVDGDGVFEIRPTTIAEYTAEVISAVLVGWGFNP